MLRRVERRGVDGVAMAPDVPSNNLDVSLAMRDVLMRQSMSVIRRRAGFADSSEVVFCVKWPWLDTRRFSLVARGTRAPLRLDCIEDETLYITYRKLGPQRTVPVKYCGFVTP